MHHKTNITRIKAVCNAISPFVDQVAFVGGATVSLYADRIFFEARPTDDVDIVVEVFSRVAFAEFEERLRKSGFVNDLNSGMISRYRVQGIIVDVIPLKPDIIGFSNLWYEEGFAQAILYDIDPLHQIKIFSTPYFIASKLEAFKGRGKNDGRTSSDFEDIIFVLNNRSNAFAEMEICGENVNTYLKDNFKHLLENKYFPEWVLAHLDFSELYRGDEIISNLAEFVRT